MRVQLMVIVGMRSTPLLALIFGRDDYGGEKQLVRGHLLDAQVYIGFEGDVLLLRRDVNMHKIFDLMFDLIKLFIMIEDLTCVNIEESYNGVVWGL